MTELTLTVVKFAYLALLWVFLFAAVATLRVDIFGVRPKPAATTPEPPVEPPAGPRRRNRKLPVEAVIIEGPDRGNRVPLQGVITIGRAADCALPINDDFASSHHARLFSEDGQWFVEDTGSTNGTYVAGSRITHPTPLTSGSSVKVGRTIIELQK